MPVYFCRNALFRKPEQWYPTMYIFQSWGLDSNGINIVSRICLSRIAGLGKEGNLYDELPDREEPLLQK